MANDKLAFEEAQHRRKKIVNTVRCSNCGAQNAADLKFCTNCGNPLPSSNFGFGQAPPINAAQSAPAIKSKMGRNAAIFGGLGCVVLLVGAIAICGILGYIGRNSDNRNSNTANLAINNDNSLLSNRISIKPANFNSNSAVAQNNNSSSETTTSTAPTDEEFRNFLMPQIGEYERQDDVVDGNVTEDYPGADKIIKADYLKRNKVNVVMAQFASPAVAKQSYGYFLDGFKTAGAKLLTRQKVKNKAGVETGDLAIYVHKNKWETLVYADRFGFRITAPDRATLVDFLRAFSTFTDLMSSK